LLKPDNCTPRFSPKCTTAYHHSLHSRCLKLHGCPQSGGLKLSTVHQTGAVQATISQESRSFKPPF
jgi:hypothetical protein